MSELTNTARAEFAGVKVLKASKWILISGTATFFLTGLLDVVAEVELPTWATLGVYLLINTLIYGVSAYIKGENGTK